jgi:hypothetical protein
MTARSPEQLLGEVGERIEAASRAAGWPNRRGRAVRTVVIAAAAAAAFGGTAAATKSIWAPDAPSTAAHGPTATVGDARVAGIAIKLDARACGDGRLSVVLRAPHGGAAGPCVPPGTSRTVFIDSASGRALAFGTAPRGAVGVSSTAGPGVLLQAPPDVERRARLSSGVLYFAVPLGDGDVDGQGVSFDCGDVRCDG